MSLPKDVIMYPIYCCRRRRRLVSSVTKAAIIVIGLAVTVTSCSGPKGSSSTASAVTRDSGPSQPTNPTPAQQAATQGPLNGPVTVVPGRRVIDGVELGFPHTIVGAISAAADEMSEGFTLDPGHAAVVGRLTADSSHLTLPQNLAEGAGSLRKFLGAPATGPVAAGYSVHFRAVEYQLRDVTADQVMVVVLCEFTYTQPGLGMHGRIGVFPFLMHWEHDDWKDAGDTDTAYLNLIAQPDSPQAAALGWNVLLY